MERGTNDQWVLQTIVAQPSYYLGTFSTVWRAAQRYFYSSTVTASATIYRFHRGVKQPWEILEKVTPLPIPTTWGFRGCNWGKSQNGGKNSKCWVGAAFQVWVSAQTAFPTSSISSGSKNRWYLRFFIQPSFWPARHQPSRQNWSTLLVTVSE